MIVTLTDPNFFLASCMCVQYLHVCLRVVCFFFLLICQTCSNSKLLLALLFNITTAGNNYEGLISPSSRRSLSYVYVFERSTVRRTNSDVDIENRRTVLVLLSAVPPVDRSSLQADIIFGWAFLSLPVPTVFTQHAHAPTTRYEMVYYHCHVRAV